MKTTANSPARLGAILTRILAVLALACLLSAPTLAQQTPGGTVITNTATATYSDGTTSYDTKSSPVTVTVANVSGLKITPDNQLDTSVVAGQTVNFVFTVTNLGNFDDQVRFLANGGSILSSGPGTIQDAFIDLNGNNTKDGLDQSIYGSNPNVDQAVTRSPDPLLKDRFNVVVVVLVNNGATTGQTIRIQLGNETGASPWDNLATSGSGTEVRTLGASVNGSRQAGGDIRADIANDAQLQVSLSAPAGPIALGSDISYSVGVCNTGARDAAATTLSGNSGVFIVMPVPSNTTLKSGQAFAGSQLTLYTTDALTTAPTAATWSSSAPGSLSSVTRVAFKVATPLLANSSPCSANITMLVTVNSGINATTPIRQMADAFANNSIASLIKDQSDDQSSGPQTPNKSDGNALNPNVVQPNAASGTPLQTTLQAVGNVLNGPLGQPGASGPSSTDDDYTNLSVSQGIAGVAPGGNTTLAGNALTFENTVQNTGNANDTYTLSVVSFPANGTGGGATVRLSTDNGANWTTLVNNGVATAVPNPTLAVNYGSSANYKVEVTLPLGLPVLAGYNTVIRAASANTAGVKNDTIDRVYTGFIRLIKTAVITNSTGIGGANDAVPGAVIEYTITYANISSNSGSNNGLLSATSVVITDDGAGTNNWAANATYVANSASSQLTLPVAVPNYGNIVVNGASTSLTDTLPGLQAGVTGTFKFSVTIR
ncbi:MAG TPA: hypothetical protein VGX92_05500 [Pyrinomonadaceae bacterium]|jgi:hypothetical protein|nr:hypothetical protein [Pyrinomonadaceae bacterium]